MIRCGIRKALMGIVRRTYSYASSAEKNFFPLNLSQKEFEMLLQLDVLGLVEQPDSNSAFHEKFTSPLHKTEDGVYETRFPWKSACPNVPRNKHNSDLWCLSEPIQPGSSLQKLVSQYKSDYPETSEARRLETS